VKEGQNTNVNHADLFFAADKVHKTDKESTTIRETVVSPGGLANNGAHISLYVDDLAAVWEAAAQLGGLPDQTGAVTGSAEAGLDVNTEINPSGVLFVNHRFSRRAYTLEEATEQCMFRTLNVVDPLYPERVLLRLEHEVRSCVTRNGSKYKSCPFDEINMY
jgi:hypothetical protein